MSEPHGPGPRTHGLKRILTDYRAAERWRQEHPQEYEQRRQQLPRIRRIADDLHEAIGPAIALLIILNSAKDAPSDRVTSAGDLDVRDLEFVNDRATRNLLVATDGLEADLFGIRRPAVWVTKLRRRINKLRLTVMRAAELLLASMPDDGDGEASRLESITAEIQVLDGLIDKLLNSREKLEYTPVSATDPSVVPDHMVEDTGKGAAEGTEEPSPRPYTPSDTDRVILMVLAKAPKTLTQVDIEAESRRSLAVVKERLPLLEEADLIDRPHGPRKGYAITSQGRTQTKIA
jgi:hypothetical protein